MPRIVVVYYPPIRPLANRSVLHDRDDEGFKRAPNHPEAEILQREVLVPQKSGWRGRGDNLAGLQVWVE